MVALEEDPGAFLEWDENEVAQWIGAIGYAQYKDLIIDQGITGDTLPYLNQSSIADIGIASIGHRLAILRAIYQLKMNMSHTGTRMRGDADVHEGYEEGQTNQHGEGDEAEEGAERGWEWTEDDWRPADEDPLSRMQVNANGIMMSPTSPGFLHPATGMVSNNPPYSASIGTMIAAYDDREGGMGIGMDDPQLARLWDIVVEQNERIAVLEQEFRKLSAAFPSAAALSFNTRNVHSQQEFKRSRSRDRTLFPPTNSHGEPSTTQVPSPTLQAESPSSYLQTSSAAVPIEKGMSSRLTAATPPQLNRMISSSAITDNPTQTGRFAHGQTHSPNVGVGSLSGLLGTPSSMPSTSPSYQAQAQADALGVPATSHSHGHLLPGAAGTGNAVNQTSPTKGDSGNAETPNTARSMAAQGSNTASAGTSASASANATASATAAAKSFRVTLEDPCWKVLPAALKKYKINDDWRMYAMFICFGNTERCLSYDEKPLLLFQKLKESGQKPVFMLRHLRDIKSPIAIAEQKQAVRRTNAIQQNLGNSTTVVTPNTSRFAAPTGSAQGTSSLNTPNLTPSATDTNPTPNDKSYTRDTRLHRPPVLQPISARAKAAAAAGALNSGRSTPGSGGQASFPDLPSPGMRGGGAGSESLPAGDEVPKAGYAVAIYPYIAEREDEFDVLVGMAFVIINKAKGWWVVQKDPEGNGNVITDSTKSGWVPAGCLLEVSQPVGPAERVDNDGKPPLADQPILPSLIVSSSFQGIALMGYEPKGEGELALKKDELLRVFKRYAHWSYSIKHNGERGWVPSWFVGKIGSSSSSSGDKSAQSTASTAHPEEGNDKAT